MSCIVRYIGIIIVISFVYFLFVKPLRIYLNEKVLAPVVDRLSGENTEFSIIKENPFAISVGREEFGNFMKIKVPFGRYWLIPLAVLLFTNSWSLIRSLTIFHVLVTLVLPVMFALIFIDSHLLTMLSSIFITLNLVFGLSFTIFGLNHLFTHKTNWNRNV